MIDIIRKINACLYLIGSALLSDTEPQYCCLSECGLMQQIMYQFLLIYSGVAAVVSWGLVDSFSPTVWRREAFPSH